MSAFFFDYCTYPDIIPHKRLYIHNPAICHSLCLSHEHSSYDIGLDNGIDNADDIDHQPNGFVYQYEKNGNLRRDNQEHIQLEWTMAGKVKKVINTVTENTKAEFLYDAMGNRVRKTVYSSLGNVERNIFYTYAPDGKLLQMTEQSNEGLLLSMEYPLYGISRLGLYKVTSSLSREDESANLHIFPRYFDRRMYELTDHLGNVRAVVGDRKLWNSSFAGEFRANVLSVSNYYPFGMAQTGRNWDGSGNYRYGYNGKEEDNEIKTNSGDNGKSLDYGARWYDPRKARWDAVDKYEAKYVGISPYVFTGNNPIIFKEIDGNEYTFIIRAHFNMRGPLLRMSDMAQSSIFAVSPPKFNKLTNEYDVTVVFHIMLSERFEPTESHPNFGSLETNNQGLLLEVMNHEYGHVEQFKSLFNSLDYKVDITIDGLKKTLVGDPLSILRQAAIEVISFETKNGKKTDASEVSKNISSLVNSCWADLQCQILERYENPESYGKTYIDLEGEADNYARRELNNKTPYLDMEKIPRSLEGAIKSEREPSDLQKNKK